MPFLQSRFTAQVMLAVVMVASLTGPAVGVKTFRSEENSHSHPVPGVELTEEPIASSASTAANQVEQLPQQPQTLSLAAREITYGFYLHVYHDPPAVIYQVRQLKTYFPGSPIYVMSDGGMDFSNLCKEEGCIFMLCPPANDRWHPWPFFRRLYDAAKTLNTEFVIMLEPDNTIHGPIKERPANDVGGIHTQDRTFPVRDYVEGLARKRVPNYNWTSVSMSAGLAGGSYFRTEAILDALSDENMMAIDWNYLGETWNKDVFSSDFAMQVAFAARGWKIAPWEESAQMDKDKDKPLTGRPDAAFRHYCACYPGGKPTYNMKLEAKDTKLVKKSPYAQASVCQLCYNQTRYIALWGSAKCTNTIPFHYSEKLMHTYHTDFETKGCNFDLFWFCDHKKHIQTPLEHGSILPPDPQDTYILSEHGDEFCPEGSVGLKDVANCKTAASKLEKKMAYEETQFNYNDPSGCVFRVSSNDVYFNGIGEGSGSSDRQIMCKKGSP